MRRLYVISLLVVILFHGCKHSGGDVIFNNAILEDYLCDVLEPQRDTSDYKLINVFLGKINGNWKIDILKSLKPLFPYENSTGNTIYYGIKPVFAGAISKSDVTVLVYCSDDESIKRLDEVLNTSVLSKSLKKEYASEIADNNCKNHVYIKSYIRSEDGSIIDNTAKPGNGAEHTLVYSSDNYVIRLQQSSHFYELTDIRDLEGVFGQWIQKNDEVFFLPTKHFYYSTFMEDVIIRDIEDFPVALQNLNPVKGSFCGDTLYLNLQEDDIISNDSEFSLDSRIALCRSN